MTPACSQPSLFDSAFSGTPVLVTGAAGFIGRHLCRILLTAGAHVHALVRPGTGRHFLAGPAECQYWEVDAGDHHGLAAALDAVKPRYVFHAAAHNAYDKSVSLRQLVADDVMSTANLLDAARATGVSRVVALGSSLEYGPQHYPMAETTGLAPDSLRGAARAASSLLALAGGRHLGLETVLVRPFSVYGPGEAQHRFIPSAIRCTVTGEELPLTAGEIRRDFVHVNDVVAACLRAAVVPGIAGEAFNIGSGVERTNEEVVAEIEAIAGRPLRVRPGAYARHKVDRPHWCADLAKARALLGWEPTISLRDGLRQMLADVFL